MVYSNYMTCVTNIPINFLIWWLADDIYVIVWWLQFCTSFIYYNQLQNYDLLNGDCYFSIIISILIIIYSTQIGAYDCRYVWRIVCDELLTIVDRASHNLSWHLQDSFIKIFRLLKVYLKNGWWFYLQNAMLNLLRE